MMGYYSIYGAIPGAHGTCALSSSADQLVVDLAPEKAATVNPAEQVMKIPARWPNVLPCRIASLEESVAAMLVLAATGQSAVWCHGVATDPIRLHAWLTVDGVPVAEPACITRYTPLFQLPDARWATARRKLGEHRQPREHP